MHECRKNTDVIHSFCSVVTNTATYADKLIRVWNVLYTFIYKGAPEKVEGSIPDFIIGIFH